MFLEEVGVGHEQVQGPEGNNGKEWGKANGTETFAKPFSDSQNQLLTHVFFYSIISLWSPKGVGGKVPQLIRQMQPRPRGAFSLITGILWGAARAELRTSDSAVLRRDTQKYSVVDMKVIELSNCSHWHRMSRRIKPLPPPFTVRAEPAPTALPAYQLLQCSDKKRLEPCLLPFSEACSFKSALQPNPCRLPHQGLNQVPTMCLMT